MRALRNIIAAAALLSSLPAIAQQGVPFFPQTLSSGTVVGRLSSGQGPTEQIPLASLLSALFPNGSTAFPFSAASVAFQGSVNGVVTVQGQAAAGTWTLQWPSTVGITGRCFGETVSASVATGTWTDCATLSGNNTWSGTQTFNGNLTVASLANFTGTFQKSGTTETFPASGVLVGTTDSQTLTNKSIDAAQLTGTIANARLPGGVNINTMVTKTANYSIASSDCAATISASGGPWTLTLPSAAGFPSMCMVQVCNSDPNDITHSSIHLSGFPAPSFDHLYMQQCQEVTNVNSAWVVTKWPGKFVPAFTVTCYVDTGGNDNNDCLVGNGSTHAVANPQHCWIHFTTELDISNGQQPTCSLTGGQTFSGGVSCSANQNPTVYFLIGNGGRAVIRNTAGNVVVQENDFCGYIIFDNVTLDCTSAATHPCIGLFLHQQNGADLSTAGFTNGVNFLGALSTDTGILCDAQCRINTGAVLTFSGQFGRLISLDYGSTMDINNGLTIAATAGISGPFVFTASKGSQLTWSGTFTLGASNSLTTSPIFFATNGSSILLSSSFAVSGSAGGSPTQWLILNNALFCNASATAVPGGAGASTASGWSAGIIAAATSGGCLP